MQGTRANPQGHFARRVNHPGTRPQSFFWKWMQPIGNRMVELIGQAATDELNQAGPGRF